MNGSYQSDMKHSLSLTSDINHSISTDKSDQWSMYETIAKCLLNNRFSLTALEFYTELLENGVDMPCLREYFADSTNFESLPSGSSTKHLPSIIDTEIDDGISRILNHDALETVSIDNLTIYSRDLKAHDGSTSMMTSGNAFQDVRVYEERIALLEWELKKARTSTNDVEKEDTDDGTMNINRGIELTQISPMNPMNSSEQCILNQLINQYLLNNNYRYTSITFAEENETFDFDQKENDHRNQSLPVDLLHLYRWYCYQSCLEQNKSTLIDFSMNVNFDVTLSDQNAQLEKSLALTVSKSLSVLIID